MPDTANNLENTGRDASGRFAKGNPGGPGRKPVLKEIAYLREIKRRVEPNDVAEVFEKVLEAAKGGDLNAAKVVFAHLLPQPMQRIAVDEKFHDPDQSPVAGEWRRAGANYTQIDAEFGEYLYNLITEQAAYDEECARLAAKHRDHGAQK